QAPPGVVALDYAVTFTSAGLNFVDPKQNWHASGTASTPIGNNGPIDWRTDDIAYSVWPDPVSGSGVYTIQCSGTQQYTREQLIVSLDSGAFARVQDVYQPIPAGISLQAIQYATGTTGLCTVVPRLQVSGPGDNEQSLFTQQVTANLRRGALVEFSGGSEIAYVLDVETGPDGSMCFTTSTTGTHTTAETLSGVPAIQAFLSSPGAGNPFYSSDWYFTVGTG